MTIWTKCGGVKNLIPVNSSPWRVVESQSVLSARNLVDTREEHDLLEEMLESSKPVIEKKTDFLIFTPFRYPPLKYGSRFGGTFEPSLWYGSLDPETALAEIAYYRILFLHHTEADLGYINIMLTAYQARIKTQKCVDLCAEPFADYAHLISSKCDYSHSQKLGTTMRNSGVEVFIYYSARALKQGKNIAAFTPNVFAKKNNRYSFNFQTWQCSAGKHSVEFVHQELKKISFIFADFATDGKLDNNPEWVNFI